MTAPKISMPFNGSNYSFFDEFYDGMFVHPHWYQYMDYFKNLPDIYYYLTGIYIGIVGMFGTLGNLLVIYIFCTTRSLRTPPNMLLVNLAMSDAGFSLINGFPLMTISSFAKRWIFGEIACTIYALVAGFFGYNSIATLAFVSMDRYYVISNPFEAMRKCTKGRAMMQIVIVWIWSLILSLLPVFGIGHYIMEGLLVSCGFDFFTKTLMNTIYIHCAFYIGFVAPVFIITICYIMIVRAVAAQSAMMRKTAEKMSAEEAKEDRERKQEIKLAKIAAGTITLFILSWISYAIVALLAVYGNEHLVTPGLSHIPALVAKTSACWNPVLYALSHPKFRAVLEEKFPFLLFCKGSNIDKGEDEKSDHTKVTKGAGLKRQDSDASGSDCEQSGMEMTSQVRSNPRGTRDHDRQPSPRNDNRSHAPAHLTSSNDVNPRAMTRAANTIFSHLVTAYEGMRVLTTSGDGAGASRLAEQGFQNPAYLGEHPPAPIPYYYPPPSPAQIRSDNVYTVPVAPYGMVMAQPGVPAPVAPSAATPAQPTTPAPQPAAPAPQRPVAQLSTAVQKEHQGSPQPQSQPQTPQHDQSAAPPSGDIIPAENDANSEDKSNKNSELEQVENAVPVAAENSGPKNEQQICEIEKLPPPPEEFYDENEDNEKEAYYEFTAHDQTKETSQHHTESNDVTATSEINNSLKPETKTEAIDDPTKDIEGTTSQELSTPKEEEAAAAATAECSGAGTESEPKSKETTDEPDKTVVSNEATQSIDNSPAGYDENNTKTSDENAQHSKETMKKQYSIEYEEGFC